MADVPQPRVEMLNQPEIFEVLRQSREGSEEFNAQLALGRVVGQFVDVRSISKDNSPITAYYYARPYPRFGQPGYRPQHGLLLRPHPHRVEGTVEAIDLMEAQLKVKPRRLSPYRFDEGHFIVNMIDAEGNPLVDMTYKP